MLQLPGDAKYNRDELDLVEEYLDRDKRKNEKTKEYVAAFGHISGALLRKIEELLKNKKIAEEASRKAENDNEAGECDNKARKYEFKAREYRAAHARLLASAKEEYKHEVERSGNKCDAGLRRAVLILLELKELPEKIGKYDAEMEVVNEYFDPNRRDLSEARKYADTFQELSDKLFRDGQYSDDDEEKMFCKGLHERFEGG